MLILRARPKRVIADWMAQQWRDGKRARRSSALTRPCRSRKHARCSNATSPTPFRKVAVSRSAPTPARARSAIRSRATSRLSKQPEELVELIRPIYERGAKSMADHVRGYLHAAYSWGMKSEHDDRSTSPRRFRIPFNPDSWYPD